VGKFRNACTIVNLLEEKEDVRLSLTVLRRVAERACRELGWQGDYRDREPLFFFVPDPRDFSAKVGMLLKQNHGGMTYVASPVLLPHLRVVQQPTEKIVSVPVLTFPPSG
jgi:hypothetical protein